MNRLDLIYLVLSLFLFSENEAWNSLNVMSNVQLTFRNRGNQTDFIVESSFGNGVYVDNAWLGIGLNSRSGVMNGASVVVCKNSPSSKAVEHYYNRGHRSVYIDSNDPSIGIKNAQISTNNTHIKCEYTRENSGESRVYFDLNNNSPYLTAAFGQGPYQNHRRNYGGIEELIEFPVEKEEKAESTFQSNPSASTLSSTSTSTSTSTLSSTLTSTKKRVTTRKTTRSPKKTTHHKI